MRLRDLARETGATTASIKFWIRSGILAPGILKNQTTAVYDERHVHRVRLIQTMRQQLDASVDEIRTFTTSLDDEDVPMIDIMQRCQQLALDLPEVAATIDAEIDRELGEAMRAAGWADATSLARTSVVAALTEARQQGITISAETLAGYARALTEIADNDIEFVAPAGPRDVVAATMFVAVATQARILSAMNNLAHASRAIAAHHDTQ